MSCARCLDGRFTPDIFHKGLRTGSSGVVRVLYLHVLLLDAFGVVDKWTGW